MDKSELRRDPLTEAWTIFSEARAMRPAYGSIAEEDGAPDPFLAGRERFAPHALHEAPRDPHGAGWQVRVVPNRAPVLRVEGDPTPRPDGFYDRIDGVGAHEVIVEDPGGRALHELSLAEVEKVVEAWKLRIHDLRRDPRMRAFFIVKDHGRAAGGLIHHSLSQLVAMAVIPPVLRAKLHVARRFFAAKKRSIFEDILAEEVRAGTRLVYENNGFAVFCPYAARSPFELAIFPKRQCAEFPGISDQERTQFADVLRTVLRKLALALDHPPCHFMLTTAPSRTPRHDEWNTIEQDFRWHVEIRPRLYPTQSLELATGCAVNTVWPEVAADYLRQTEVPA
jgi:UDPglucose--hexose-1-phosphate uridylyltransferase